MEDDAVSKFTGIKPTKRYQLSLVDPATGKRTGETLTVGERVADSIRELTQESASLENYTAKLKAKKRPTSRIVDLNVGINDTLASGFEIREQKPKRKSRRMK